MTWAIPRSRESVMPRLAELVVKPRSGLGGEDVTVCRLVPPGRASRGSPS